MNDLEGGKYVEVYVNLTYLIAWLVMGITLKILRARARFQLVLFNGLVCILRSARQAHTLSKSNRNSEISCHFLSSLGSRACDVCESQRCMQRWRLAILSACDTQSCSLFKRLYLQRKKVE
jgi:hypothetical protein